VVTEQRMPANEGLEQNFTIRIAQAMRERIDHLAAQEKRSAGYIARLALERGLEALEDASKRGERL
jgi:predicted DNA-binding protein